MEWPRFKNIIESQWYDKLTDLILFELIDWLTDLMD